MPTSPGFINIGTASGSRATDSLADQSIHFSTLDTSRNFGQTFLNVSLHGRSEHSALLKEHMVC